jgi:hypothetical protein
MISKEKVNQAKEDFLMEVNRLKYVTTLMDEHPIDFTHSSLTSAVNGVIKSYENFINSKIEFTDEYFKKDYWEQFKKD